MAYAYSGQFNSYVAKATGQIIAFARNPKRYKVNQYTQLVPTKTELGLYYYLHPDDFVKAGTPNEALWMDGAKRPEKTGQRIRHKTQEFQCMRYDYDFQIGWRTLQVADYKVLLANTNSAQNECMLDWTKEVIDLGEAASNWAGNTAAATDLAGGGLWDSGTPQDPVLKKSLGQIAETITLGTNGMAADYENEDDVGLYMVLSPTAARRIASSPEVHAIFKESLYAEAMLTKGSAAPGAVFQIPKKLYGFTVVVENAVIVTGNPVTAGTLASTSGSPAPRRFVKDYSSCIICSRPGGLDGELGAPNFSTFQRYYVDSEMQLKIFDEAKHEYTDGHINRFGVSKLAAPAAGFLVTNILAAA